MNLAKHPGSRSADFLATLTPGARIANLGSGGVRFKGFDCTNFDIQGKANVDCRCDIQQLPDWVTGKFDAVVCVAALQYCEFPHKVAAEALRALKPGGKLFIDAPWCQPYCPDTPDLTRFSANYLRLIFKEFDILEVGPSITSGSAFMHLGADIADNMSANRYLRWLYRKAAIGALWLLRRLATLDETKTAGCNLSHGSPIATRCSYIVSQCTDCVNANAMAPCSHGKSQTDHAVRIAPARSVARTPEKSGRDRGPITEQRDRPAPGVLLFRRQHRPTPHGH